MPLLAAPFRLYITPVEETLKTEVFFPISSLYRRRRRLKIGAARRRCPGTLLEGGITSGSPSISMDASRMGREYSTLDHGSMTSSYVMFYLLPCASSSRPRETPYMIEALM